MLLANLLSNHLPYVLKLRWVEAQKPPNLKRCVSKCRIPFVIAQFMDYDC